MGHQTPADVRAEVSRLPQGARSAAVHQKALNAAADLLVSGGLKAATVEAVSDVSGVSKVTLYRHWPSRQAIAAEAFGQLMREHLVVPRTDDPPADLVSYLVDIGAFYRGPLGVTFAELVGACANDPTTAAYFRTFFLDERRKGFATLVERCVESGYFRADADIDEVIDLFFGPLVYRTLVGHASVDDRAVNSIINHAIRGLRADPGPA
ncbi:TetR/AcrR family transcriptional regulator [Microbacterium sp. LWO13-1.2]|uniref:TetR/AcrR family transcriptional regulator n=1 Tax=Microbacterium sp. LWO13-1.2 TaxID=3135262 RepID=UPI0031391EE2